MKMKEYDFSLVANCEQPIDEDVILQLADALYEAGCDDSTVMSKGNTILVEFDREAKDYESAVVSAIQDLNKVAGLKGNSFVQADHEQNLGQGEYQSSDDKINQIKQILEDARLSDCECPETASLLALHTLLQIKVVIND